MPVQWRSIMPRATVATAIAAAAFALAATTYEREKNG
jgi:hypothetical protein